MGSQNPVSTWGFTVLFTYVQFQNCSFDQSNLKNLEEQCFPVLTFLVSFILEDLALFLHASGEGEQECWFGEGG